jgi:DNA-binding response OmpR family regulator
MTAASERTQGAILVVESDPDVGRVVVEQLTADGYRAELALSAEHARMLARASSPRLAVLGELDAPRGALALLEEIRAPALPDTPWEEQLPTIVVGREARELDVLRAFEAGADDFVARPARYLELRARLRAILRRTERTAGRGRSLQVGALAIDTNAHAVSLDGQHVDLRRQEYQLLVHLAGDPDRVFGREELLRSVWGYRSCAATRTLDSHASRLRRKLDVDGSRRWVINVHGVGYRLI